MVNLFLRLLQLVIYRVYMQISKSVDIVTNKYGVILIHEILD
jgi:hypothetical protein